uniref:Small ribosomal subunit protein mS23 n=1 Tax=Geotrypetes seraphini TaxID=260995 RepID=A0A6P8NLX2_GEOSA|nr:28S ribosomal protein S23, mitochondrial isoform X2 [Geotrypetes seraphini]
MAPSAHDLEVNSLALGTDCFCLAAVAALFFGARPFRRLPFPAYRTSQLGSMASRLEKLGTIFTRVRDLMRASVIKQSDKPIWYDVYAAFPPKREPLYQEPPRRFSKVEDNVPPILYEEDVIRAKFFEFYGNGPRLFDLSRSNFKSSSQR